MDYLYSKINKGSTSIVEEVKKRLESSSLVSQHSFPKYEYPMEEAQTDIKTFENVHKHDNSGIREDLGSYIILDSKVFIDLVYDAYLEKPCPICLKFKIYLDHYTSQGGSSSLQLSCHTKGCTWTKRIRCSSPILDGQGHRMKYSELPGRLVYSFMLAGLTYKNYEEVLTLLDVDYLSNSQFINYCNKLHSAVSSILDPILKQNRMKMKELNSSIIMIDGRWSSRGWNANECTVSVFNAVTKELLYVEHVLRKLGSSDKYGKYIGASSAMEGHAIEIICKKFVEEDVSIDMVVHDHDGETMKIINKYYPDAGEYFDVAHKGKNLKKKIIKMKKDFPELAGFGDRVLRSFIWCLKNCYGDASQFQILMRNQYNHFCDISHEECSHDKQYHPKWTYITDEDTRSALWSEYSDIMGKADKYVKRFGTNAAESFNGLISKFCNKRLNLHNSYTLRANIAALQYVKPDYRYAVMKALNVEISNNLKEAIFEDVVKKEKQHNIRQKEEYKEKTKVNRSKKRKRNVNTSNQYEYKGRKLTLTIKQLKEKINLMGVKVPSRLKKKEDINKFYEDLQILPNIWVEIEPLDIEEEEEEEKEKENQQ